MHPAYLRVLYFTISPIPFNAEQILIYILQTIVKVRGAKVSLMRISFVHFQVNKLRPNFGPCT